ncbi:MAG TPA: UDP-N-acetylmuramoyl-L-alanine--D-glutamate ligase, partial [Candidatus Omnitrophota bacterium]|nr:UDP-N-acetylmuramoyl-L-alanine--D-glutamate ligase [Candidatus Omnitrophota bacterium]
MRLKGKRVTVVGLGKSGAAAARFLIKNKAKVRVTDGSESTNVLKEARTLRKLGAQVETGGHTASFVRGADLLVTSPGVPKNSLPLETAAREKIPVISEIELGASFCKGTIIGVTGSNGKTTTCHLLHEILKAAGKKSVLCGNVGHSFVGELAKIDRKTFVVLELSSFQLEDCPRFRPKIALILNLSANHLNRHGTMDSYARAKEGIFRSQRTSDRLILNADDPIVKRMAVRAHSKVCFFSKTPLKDGAFLSDGELLVRRDGKNVYKIKTATFGLRGDHNLENILACAQVAALVGVSGQDLERTLRRFKTLEHRIEPLGRVRGVQFFNDSKSTTVASTTAAIRAMRSSVVLVAGGRDKGSDFKQIEPLVRERVKEAVLYGESRQKIAASWKRFKKIKMERDFTRAVSLA